MKSAVFQRALQLGFDDCRFTTARPPEHAAQFQRWLQAGLHGEMDYRIYGCDDCLAACPWNRFARQGAMMRPHFRPDLAAPELIELLSLDEAAFARRFAGTPIRRVKRRGLLRNVCVALGNIGDEAALPALARAAADAEPLVAEHARWAIARLQARAAAVS